MCTLFRRILKGFLIMHTTNFIIFTEPVILSPTTGPSLLRSFSAPPASLTKYVVFIFLNYIHLFLGVEVLRNIHGRDCMHQV